MTNGDEAAAAANGNAGAAASASNSNKEGLLKITQLLSLPQVQTFIMEADCAFYQKVVNFLMPKVGNCDNL